MAGLQRSSPQDGALVPLRPARRNGLGQARARHPSATIDPAPTAFAHRANPNKNSSKRPPRGRTCESA
eukprot:scaffold16200_cov153-Isochrysis_galbana.AAC.3